jgi:hypothetical protein
VKTVSLPREVGVRRGTSSIGGWVSLLSVCLSLQEGPLVPVALEGGSCGGDKECV